MSNFGVNFVHEKIAVVGGVFAGQTLVAFSGTVFVFFQRRAEHRKHSGQISKCRGIKHPTWMRSAQRHPEWVLQNRHPLFPNKFASLY
jgi:hypothetical protein